MLMLIWFVIQIQDLFTGISTTAACRIGSKCKKWAELLSIPPDFDSDWHTYQFLVLSEYPNHDSDPRFFTGISIIVKILCDQLPC